MILPDIFRANRSIVLVILCVLVSWSCAQEGVHESPCDISVKDDETLSTTPTVNCSRRDLDSIPSWPKEILDIDKDAHLLITFYNNSLSRVSVLPSAPGKRIAVSFQCNHIVYIEDDAFANLGPLVYLDLSKNNLTGTSLRSNIFRGKYDDTRELYPSLSLEIFLVGGNEIDSLHADTFEYIPNLTQLYLNNNPIETLTRDTVKALSTLYKLKYLDLANTGLKDIPLGAFENLVSLQTIDLSGNQFIVVPESLSLIGKSLEYLTFNNNPIVELNDDSFIGLTNLKVLEVGQNEYLEEVKRSTFSPLINLKRLHLCHNPNLRYISHTAFRGLKNWTLAEVYLDDNNLSELSTDLMPWKKLEVLGMTGNNWLCNCDLANIVTVQEAGKKFPKDQIPYCAAPMRLSGAYITNITATFCPTFDTAPKKTFNISDLKPKHVLWSIFGVATVVGIGMVMGLLVNFIRNILKRRSQPVRYINLYEDSSFA